jgi:hypothetical protein
VKPHYEGNRIVSFVLDAALPSLGKYRKREHGYGSANFLDKVDSKWPTQREQHASYLSRVIHVNTPNSPLKLLKQKRSENDVEGIDVKIASAPPETSDLLLTYRETAISLRAAIDLLRQTTPAIAT